MKTKPPKEILKRREQRPHQQIAPTPERKSIWKKLEWSLGIGVGISGLILTALQFQARPTASLDTPLDPNNVFTTPLIISNDGLTDLENVRFETFIKDAKYDPGNIHLHDAGGRRFLDSVDTLLVGDKQTVMPMEMIQIGKAMGDTRITELDFSIFVSFRPAYWPWQKRRFFRFRLATNADGKARLQEIAAGDIEHEYDASAEYRRNLQKSR